MGNLFGALTDYMVARLSKGVAYLRIEKAGKSMKSKMVYLPFRGVCMFGIEFDAFDKERLCAIVRKLKIEE